MEIKRRWKARPKKQAKMVPAEKNQSPSSQENTPQPNSCDLPYGHKKPAKLESATPKTGGAH
jgi:hypothetical protein